MPGEAAAMKPYKGGELKSGDFWQHLRAGSVSRGAIFCFFLQVLILNDLVGNEEPYCPDND